MTRNDIIKMAREADMIDFRGDDSDPHVKQMIDFFEVVIERAVASEREACAKVCRNEADRALWNWKNDISGNQPFWNGAEQMAANLSNAIRARGSA